MNKKLWQKGNKTEPLIESFTTGKDKIFDRKLARYDVLGSLAHAQMLAETGIITREEGNALMKSLLRIYAEIEQYSLAIEDGVEDIHSQIERMLTKETGETGKKIHTGRSRNDQVLLDLRLYFREEIEKLTTQIHTLFKILIDLSEKNKETLLPGYTHFQAAMPSSFGLWFAAYAESLLDDTILLQAVYRIINKNPLGSAAGYGSSFPLKRSITTRLLGFEDMNYNSVYAQMGRGKTERLIAQVLSGFAATIGKMAMDICLFNSQNFNFLQLPDSMTTGSSIMPHKKNPDVFELIRARCNAMQALPNTITMIGANLPSGYHRDWQILKEYIFPALEEMYECLELMIFALPKIIVNKDIMRDAKYDLCFSVDAVNELVKNGTPFRDAYHLVAEQIQKQTFKKPAQLDHTHEGSMGNLCNDVLKKNMRNILDGFGFKKVKQTLQQLLEKK
ncbi:MAG: argininosuccinate lyase [Calditrichaceae bacterium]|nr:argininosuccinate lyase [Calditrichaceae bacterium]MBN2710572.1 argininosuccinate lyase [Calditrichaceae bacterium]